MIAKILEWVMDWLLGPKRWIVLAAIGVGTAWIATYAANVPVDEQNLAMYSTDRQVTELAKAFDDVFGEFREVVVAVEGEREFGEKALAAVRALAGQIVEIEGVRKTFTAADLEVPYEGEYGRVGVPLIPDPYNGGEFRRRAAANPDLAARFFSADEKTTAILVELLPEAHPGELIDSIHEIAAPFEADGYVIHLAGTAVQKHVVARFVDRDSALLIPLSVVVLSLCLGLVFRRVLAVVLPVTVTLVTLIWTLGLYSFFGFEMNPVTALLPPVVLAIAVATSVHVIRDWLQSSKPDVRDRLRAAILHELVPCFVASTTTAFGFLSLTLAKIPAVSSFGLFAAVGSLAAFVLAFSLIPAILMSFPAPKPFEPPTVRWLQRIADVSVARPGMILVIAGAMSVIAALSISKIRNNTDLIGFLPDESWPVRDAHAIDHAFGVGQVLELVVVKPGELIADIEDWAHIRRFVEHIEKLDGVHRVDSLLSLLDQFAGGREEVPDDPIDFGILVDVVFSRTDPETLERFVSADFEMARIRVLLGIIGTARVAEILDEIDDFGGAIFGSTYQFAAAGELQGVVQDSNGLVATQVRSFGLAFVLIFGALGVVLRSVRLLALTMVPNLLPVLWVAGAFGLLGIDLSTGTVMIISVLLGIAVDDTIHFLFHYRESRARRPVEEAIRRTTTGCGSALAATTFVLACGFWVGSFGSFEPTVHFSILTGLSLFSALGCDLLVLPACLVLGERFRDRWQQAPVGAANPA